MTKNKQEICYFLEKDNSHGWGWGEVLLKLQEQIDEKTQESTKIHSYLARKEKYSHG